VLQYVLPNVILWPFVGPGTIFLRQPLYALLEPLRTLGLTGSLLYVLYTGCHVPVTSFRKHLFIGVASGLTGSVLLSGFSSFLTVLFGLLYGVLWGSLVGFGVWKSQRDAQLAA